MRKTTIILAAIAGGVFANVSFAQVDSVSTVLTKADTVGGFGITSPPSLGAIGYRPADLSDPLNPVTEAVYATGFNNTAQDIRRIDNPGTPSQTITRLFFNTAWVSFLKGGNLDRGGGTPTPFSLVLNKTAVGSTIPAYGAAFITDGGGIVTTGATQNPELTQRVYRFDIASAQMTSLVTLKQMQDALSTTTTNANVGRQVALSHDSSTVYFDSIGGVFQGLWKVPALGGQVQQIVADPDMLVEPTLTTIGGTDRLYIRGTATSSNVAGIDYYDTSDNTRKMALSGTALAALLETTTSAINIAAMGSDAAGNIYFNNVSSTPDRRGVYELDTQGRVVKIASYAERNVASQAASGTTSNVNVFRMQARTTNYNNSFDITQILYAESSGATSTVAGLNVFKVGDFNRDNAVTRADTDAFGQLLTPMATTTLIPVANSRYDLNGNNLINYRDVRVLQTFLHFSDGDTNFDGSVNFDDLLVLAQNYGTPTGETWIYGDFNGDDAVNFDDLLTLAQNYGSGPTVLSGSGVSPEFATDWALAQSLVPEPASLTVVTLGALMLAGKRRERRAL